MSDLEIEELRGVTGSGRLEVRIRRGGVPEEICAGAAFGRFCRVSAGEYLLRVPGIGGFYAGRGTEVRVELIPDAPAADVSAYLLGSVFGALCHQNGLLPLHGSAVEKGGVVTAFLGESGAGKSTLAACLQRRGYEVVADDICLLEQQGEAMGVVPVAGWLKLWRESLEHLGERAEERNRTFSEDDKYRVYLTERAGSGAEQAGCRALRMGSVVVLGRTERMDEAPTLEPMSAAETIGAMMRMMYVGYVAELGGSEGRAFEQCARMMRDGRGYRLRVPWGWKRMDEVLDLVEAMAG